MPPITYLLNNFMKKHSIKLIDNPYYRSPPGLTSLTNTFDTVSENPPKYVPREFTLGLDDVFYFQLLLNYEKRPNPDTDLFEFFQDTDISFLRDNRNAILTFDNTFEGYPDWDLAIARSLEFSCIKHSINPKKMFLFTGNLKEINHNTLINIVPIFLLHLSFKYGKINFNTINLEKSKTLCKENYSNIGLSLSRRNRPHRVYAHYMLTNSEIFHNFIMSQDRLEENVMYPNPNILQKMESKQEDFVNFSKILPILADGDNFNINSPFEPLIDLHSKTAFSIVNETHIDTFDNRSIFFSEKFLKPIINFQPFVIYGQPYINKNLSILGFKTYESYFNLDFDDEIDDIYRYKKLLTSITDTVKYLNSLDRNQQIEWRFKELEILQFNYDNFLSLNSCKTQLEKFLYTVRELIYN